MLRQEYYILVFFWIRRVQVRDLTGQPDYQPLTRFFVSGFLILARFLLGFWCGFYDYLFKFKRKYVEVDTILFLIQSTILLPKEVYPAPKETYNKAIINKNSNFD